MFKVLNTNHLKVAKAPDLKQLFKYENRSKLRKVASKLKIYSNHENRHRGKTMTSINKK